MARVEFTGNQYAEENFEFFDQRLLDAVQSNKPLVHDFFKILALCHTVMPEVKGKGTPLCKCTYTIFVHTLVLRIKVNYL